MEDNDLEGALVVSFIWVPEFGKVVIWDGINELISKDGLHGNGGVKLFLHLCVWLSVLLNSEHCFHWGWLGMIQDVGMMKLWP